MASEKAKIANTLNKLKMLISISLIVVALILPMIIEVNREMIKDDNNQRHNLLFQLFVIIQCILAIPMYYFLLIRETISKLKNK